MNEKYLPVVALICGLMLGIYMIPNSVVIPEIPNKTSEDDGREWHLEKWGALGNLDSAYSSGNSSILGIWVVNHSTDIPETWMDGINDTTGVEINNSCTEYGYAQGSSFDIEVPHTTDLDLLIFVRVNATNAADGTMFNDTWVRVNITTGSGLGCTGGVNLSGIVTHNTSGEPAMYMLFIFNGTGTGMVPYAGLQGDNYAMCGSGFQIARDNRSYITSIKLLCYY